MSHSAVYKLQVVNCVQ
uniref:Uncharacterized protein n=1 Tax=Rhizophora mucronata TaxID=61149 RepID=A0A2P2PQ75_RHIMU